MLFHNQWPSFRRFSNAIVVLRSIWAHDRLTGQAISEKNKCDETFTDRTIVLDSKQDIRG